jgi:hypothetical protein
MPNEKCPYCHEDADGYTKTFGMFSLHQNKFDGWQLYAGKGKPRQINYCPMCGRELRGADNDN